jgi:hypothetical protein
MLKYKFFTDIKGYQGVLAIAGPEENKMTTGKRHGVRDSSSEGKSSGKVAREKIQGSRHEPLWFQPELIFSI